MNPKPTAAAVGVFLSAAACSKTRCRGVHARALREGRAEDGKQKAPTHKCGQGRGGDAALKNYRGGTQKNAVLP